MKQAVTASTMRHMFTTKVLDRLPGLFGTHRYLYHCARCKWSFVVNDGRRGVLTPIDDHGTPLAHDEAVARAATFALGPCPAMHRLTEAHVHVNGSNGHNPAHVEGAGHSGLDPK
jgi:hypothetical protein